MLFVSQKPQPSLSLIISKQAFQKAQENDKMLKFKHTLWKHTFHIDIFLIVRFLFFFFSNQLQPVIPSAIQFHEHICISFHIDKILHHKNRNCWEQATKMIKNKPKTKPDLYRHQIRMRKKIAVCTEQLCKF